MSPPRFPLSLVAFAGVAAAACSDVPPPTASIGAVPVVTNLSVAEPPAPLRTVVAAGVTDASVRVLAGYGTSADVGRARGALTALAMVIPNGSAPSISQALAQARAAMVSTNGILVTVDAADRDAVMLALGEVDALLRAEDR